MSLRQILQEFQELTEEEESLYYDAFCFYCSHKIESQEEYNSHYCASKAAVKSYYKYEDHYSK
jgi:hypothetical protein